MLSVHYGRFKHYKMSGYEQAPYSLRQSLLMKQSDSGGLHFGCVTRHAEVVSSLKDLSPAEFGTAARVIRGLFDLENFHEIVLSPIDGYPCDHIDAIYVPALGQLRFNTEPEIWDSRNHFSKFYSITPLFRNEPFENCLRRKCFYIADLYQPGEPALLLPIFFRLLELLERAGLARGLAQLKLHRGQYNSEADGPIIESTEPSWLLTTGYSAANSFFEIDSQGKSTRQELFLVTRFGYLEIGALGIVGTNQNPNYFMRLNQKPSPSPKTNTSGMGIGLERLLLADQLLE